MNQKLQRAQNNVYYPCFFGLRFVIILFVMSYLNLIDHQFQYSSEEICILKDCHRSSKLQIAQEYTAAVNLSYMNLNGLDSKLNL